ncbi:MAG TPA: PfkB family carbohydrate kinase [Propionibacteriaceae bacterium]|nr:PfkB family carbohydrate kinase [Propionibacteriaceae bacterium]
MTLDLITCGEAMGLVESERIGPLRLGGPMRMSMAGTESTVALGVVRLGGSARWVGVVGDDEVGQLVRRTLSAEGVETDWKGLPTRAEVDLLRGADVLR